ncbi:RING-9 protein [Rutstroemia sp. NJR-2017a BBW]|nr:RING-9 protein [Rutstroemia sp. NJR-2017a BBW]
MRAPRVVIIVAFLLTTFFLTFVSLRSSHSPETVSASSTTPRTGIKSLFSNRAPFSLFPPNAIITLTHDNTTAFLARPAAFGPLLPSDGLKGQLWIGSGFGDDSIRQDFVAAAEGELGCSDVPGWVDNFAKSGAVTLDGEDKSATKASKSKSSKRSSGKETNLDDEKTAKGKSAAKKDGKTEPSVDDGTDDYLHHPLPGSAVSKPTDKQAADLKGNHADIQSIQEGAEIAGKIVLLSRGGCGFLEKVKWAQRRGAKALIVGDDKSGGPLTQMYARGDTSNVTIPAVFTSRTTAHLLSSLIGQVSFTEDSVDEGGKTKIKSQEKNDKPKKAGKKKVSGPTFTPTTAASKSTSTPRANSRKSTKTSSKTDEKSTTLETEKPGWFRSLFFGNGGRNLKVDSSRPPSSGQLDWVLVDDWKDDDNYGTKKISTSKSNEKNKPEVDKKTQQHSKNGEKPASADDFVIGVQDWRDPDLVGPAKIKESEETAKGNSKTNGNSDVDKSKNDSPQPTSTGKKILGSSQQEESEPTPKLRGGSITPGSGEYTAKLPSDVDKGSKSKGILTTIFGDDEEDFEFIVPGSSSTGSVDIDDESNEDNDDDSDNEEEGLWVTLTPTSGASPFLDTLLVLVVSPLVTLTVVYALLVLRSRIRRRRWRAPKSVVDKLPVRTYQTIIRSGSQSPLLPSPTSSSATATTPLLQHQTPSRPRPRSRTTTGIPEPGDLSRVNSVPLQVPTLISTPRGNEREKNVGSPSQWKKYMGKQVECVVCLEEYVDGVSQVMSLPCGHEFHVDCITPWLTTRRRTCPICKGDVVRSLARGAPSSPRYEPYRDDDSEDDVQAQAAETVNRSSSAALPISRDLDEEIAGDLESGTPQSTRRPADRSSRIGHLRNIIIESLRSPSRSPRPEESDRDR